MFYPLSNTMHNGSFLHKRETILRLFNSLQCQIKSFKIIYIQSKKKRRSATTASRRRHVRPLSCLCPSLARTAALTHCRASSGTSCTLRWSCVVFVEMHGCEWVFIDAGFSPARWMGMSGMRFSVSQFMFASKMCELTTQKHINIMEIFVCEQLT